MLEEQTSVFDEYLVEGERIIASTEKIFESTNESTTLGISSERILLLYGKNFFNDIKYGNIVTLGWKHIYKYLDKMFLTLFLSTSLLFVGINMQEEILKNTGFVFLGVSILFFIAYLSSKKTVFFISTTDGKEYHYDLKGINSKRISKDFIMGIRNSEKKYIERTK